MINRELMEDIESKSLNSYACFSRNAARRHKIKSHDFRTEFQRDRDRIIHSKAFRRLEYKTQVFLTQKGDHLRTRLTHSLEVSQLSRTIARALGLNEDLTEAIALGHDLGHTPFGHIGEETLIKLIKDKDYSFKHNLQSVRILDYLEQKYDSYQGLNLTIPVLEGILKHTDFPDNLPYIYKDYFLDKKHSVTLEGQIVAIADEIAQITHDTDDYLRYEIISIEKLMSEELFELVCKKYIEENHYDIKKQIESSDDTVKIGVIIRCLVDYLVTNLIEDSKTFISEDLEALEINDLYIKFNPDFYTLFKKFKKNIFSNIKSDYRIAEMDRRGIEILNTLYAFYTIYPRKLPDSTQELLKDKGDIVLIDYLSGMTDRYAIEQYNSIIDMI